MPSQEAEKSNNPSPDDVELTEPVVEHLSTDLQHASDEDLWYEMARRHEACVMLFLDLHPTKPVTLPGLAYSGGFYAAVGLIQTAEKMIGKVVNDDVNDWHRTGYPYRYPDTDNE